MSADTYADLAPSLTVDESTRLAEQEAVIERGMTTFLAVGEALLTIRTERLYRAEFGTFEDYCRERWGLSARHVNRTIEAAQVATSLGPIGPKIENESQARELGRVPAEQRADVWAKTLEQTDGKPTAAAIKEAAQAAQAAAPADPLPAAVAEAVAEHEAERAENRQRREEIKALNDQIGYTPDPAAEAEKDRRTALLYPFFDAVKVIACMPAPEEVAPLIEDYQRFRLDELPAAQAWLASFADMWKERQ